MSETQTPAIETLTELEVARIRLGMAVAARKINPSTRNTARWAAQLGKVRTLMNAEEQAAKLSKVSTKGGWGKGK